MKAISKTILIILFLFTVKALCQNPWKLVYSFPEFVFTDLAANDSVLVAFAENDSIFICFPDSSSYLFSIDGMHCIKSVCTYNGIFVAVGDT